MDKKTFFIVTACMTSTVCLTKLQDFDCSGREYNIALVYDCHYSLQLQHDFFFQFLYRFKPFQFYINAILMTHGRSNLLKFVKLTQENMTWETFDKASLQLKTSSCHQNLPLNTLLKDTRDALSGVNKTVTKLAIFVLSENLTEYENDDVTVSRGMENEQSLNVDVKRLFILVKPSVELEVKNQTLIYTSTLQNYVGIVKTIIHHICNPCSKDDHHAITIDGNCYHVLPLNKVVTFSGAANICVAHWPYTRLVSFNTKWEYKEFILQWNILLETIADNCRKGVISYDGLIDCNTTLVNGSQVMSFDAVIGLSAWRNNVYKYYTWSDRTPLVIDPPWGSRIEGKACVYMSQKYDYSGDFLTREQLEWNEMDCNKKKNINFAICESYRIDVRKLSLTLSDIKPKKQESNVHFLYKSYSLLMFNIIHDKFVNVVKSLMEEYISIKFIQKDCKKSCQKYKESDEMDINKNIGNNSELFLSTQSRDNSCEINLLNCHTLLLNSYNHTCNLFRVTERNSKLLNGSSFDNKYLRDPGTTVSTCLYEIDIVNNVFVFPDNKHLQDCEQFECPPGYFKCPESYCIPVYLVGEGYKDCPNGEDERFINNETRLCAGKLKFTPRNICLQQEICSTNSQCINRTNDFVCQVPCDTGYACVSNIVRRETGNDTTFYITFVETTVQIYDNLDLFIFTPVIYSFFQLFKLVEVDLSSCRIRDLDNVIKSLDISDVIILDVSRNSIFGDNNISVIQEMKNLQKLNMSFNKHLQIGDNLIFPLHLQVIDLSHTKCGSGVIKYLVNLTCLVSLELRNVEPIDLSLTGNVQLDILDVRGTELINIKDGYLSWLSIQTALYTDDFRICCEVVRGKTIAENKCHAPRDAISTCQDLIGDPQKRIILWVVGILALLGNIVVVIYRIVWDRAIFNKAYGFFVVCLAVSDFIMGVYLIIIAGADLVYRNMYVLEDSNWRYSNICKLAGILSTFSSETSTMFICLITLDRYLVIKYPFGQRRFSKTGKITSLCLTLIIGVVVSVIPVLFPGCEIYSTNGMCLALPFNSGRHTEWEYSAILFVGLNFFLFILIAIGQLAIFLAITSYKHDSFCGTRDALRKAQELSIAKQLFIVAFSDFCCWFPIGIMGIMSLNGFQFNLDVYAWSAVLILPVNSAINPLIYMLPVILKKIKSVDVVFYQK